MTAGGQEDKIEQAKKILKNGIIGLIIILSAWGIATFVLTKLMGATNGTGSSGGCSNGQYFSCGCGGSMSCIDGDWGPCLGSDCNLGGGPTSCDGNALMAGCQATAQICADDSFCDDESCSCLPKGELGDSCDAEEDTPTCDADNNLCGEYLSCNVDSCLCEGQPVITRVSPIGGFCEEDTSKACLTDDDCAQTCNITTPNGADGNLMTIMGTNFGAYDPENSRVLFADNQAGVSPSAVNPECIDSWTNKQIIIVVPENAASGKLMVAVADDKNDTTDNDIGPKIPDFIANDLIRPGLCSLTPEEGQLSEKVNYQGTNLYNGGQAYFGDYSKNVRGLDSVFANPAGLSGTTTIPNLEKGGMSSFVVGSINGVLQRSNYVNFIKKEEPDAGPYISYFEPVTGRAGQYVTIHGGGFGGGQGVSKVYFGEVEADYTFPEVCASSVWKDKQIIVKVPADLENGNYEIKVALSDQTVTSQNANPNVFKVDADASLKSSICKISPARGKVGTVVSLWGEYFGNLADNGLTVFSRDKSVSGVIVADGGAQRLDPSVPDQAVSGPVKVVKNNEWGNDVNFEIGACSKDSECSGEICCPAGTYKQGRCAPALGNCYIDIPRSVFEWGFSTGFGSGDIPVEFDSCNGMAEALGACQINQFCPNSPGVCSPFAATTTVFSVCDSSCTSDKACVGQTAGCSFNSDFDACVLNNSSCSLNSDFKYTLGDIEFSAFRSCSVFPQFGGQAHWQIKTSTSCPKDWVRLDGNTCVDSTNTNTSSCSLCADGFNCKKNGDSEEGLCASSELCKGEAKCDNNKCKSVSGSRCDCCCEIGQDKRDCCSPLTCGGTCGSDTTAGDGGFGECTGCTVKNGTIIDVSASDQACNCSNHSGKYCDTSTETGNCVDCSRLSPSSCKAHSQACCLDSKGTTSEADDVCRGGSGVEISSDVSSPNYGYCAYFNCGDASSTPPVAPSECASSTPLKFGDYISKDRCDDACESDPGGDSVCGKLNGNQTGCAAMSGCCYNFSDNKCKKGSDKTAAGYCAYYNCKAAPNDDQCDNSNKLATGTYSGVEACLKGCPYDPIVKPGLDCRSMSSTSTTSCNQSFCGSPLSCLNSEGAAGLPSNCGACCCEVGNASSCSGYPNPNLVCQPNQAPCSGEKRGLCCGCSADTDCGDTANVGCDSGTCCRTRPSVITEKMIPAHGSGDICRNAEIEIPFDQTMDPASLMDNLILLEENDYGAGVCPSGTFVAAADGFKPQIQNWFGRIFASIGRSARKIIHLVGLQSDSALADLPDASKLYCSVPGTISAEASGNGTIAFFSPKKTLSPATNYYIVVKGDQELDSNSGVMSQWQLGLNGQGYLDLESGEYVEGENISFNNLTYKNSYISSFKTLSAQGSNAGICTVDYIHSEPVSYLFQNTDNDLNENDTDPSNATFDTKSDRDKVISAGAYSADGQLLHPTSGYYWDWEWSIAKPSIASMQEVNGLVSSRVLVAATAGVTDDSTILNAKIKMDRFSSPNCNSSSSCVCAEPDCLNNCCNAYQDGDGLSGETPLFIFLCKNPWPAVNPANQSWAPWYDTCNGAIGNCQNYNYKFYYCRDAGKDGLSDDLPAMINPAVIRGTGSALVCSEGREACTSVGSLCGPDNNADGVGDGFCIWDVLKESYFFKELTPQAGAITAAIDEEDGKNIRVEWKSPSSLIYNADPNKTGKFRLYYAPVSAGNMSFVDVKPGDINQDQRPVCTPAAPISGEDYSCAFNINNLELGQTYRFKVSAISAAQVESVLSDEKIATVTDQIAPATPQGFSGTVSNPQRLSFTWQANTGDTLFYRLYHGVASGQYGESFDSDNNATSMEISAQQFGSGVHYFSLTAIDAAANESIKAAPIILTLAAE